MTENLQYWNKMAQPPEDALKPIKAGRLKGMTDISPQWRLKVMTEVYGPCGDGWKYEIEKLWTEPGNDGQVMAFALVNVWFAPAGDGDKWSDPIPGIGGSMLVTNEKKGLHTSDEGYKMAVTDALSVAFKALGVGADIYMGRWDGGQYNEPAVKITEEHATEINTLLKDIKELGGEVDFVKMLEYYGAPTLDDMTEDDYTHAKKILDGKVSDLKK